MPRTGLSRPDTARSRVSTARPGTSRASSSRATTGTWVVAISEGRNVGREVGIAAVDRETGRVIITQVADCQTYVKTLLHLSVHSPAVIVAPDTFFAKSSDGKLRSILVEYINEEFPAVPLQQFPRRFFNGQIGEEFVAQLSLQDQERAALLVSVHDRYYALQAVCAVFKFIEISFSTIYAHHTLSIKYHAVEGSMMIDTDTARNLELVDSISRQKAHSLFGLLNSTLTPQGSRLLRTSLLSPLTSQSAIEARLDAVANLVQSDEHYNSIHNAIKGVQKIDMDKLIVRLAAIDKSGEISSGVGLESIAVKTAYERLGQLLDLQKVIKNLPVVAHAASETQARLLRIIGELVLDPRITEIRQVIERHLNDTSIGPKRGSVGALSTVTARVYAVKAEANPLLDVARASYKENVHDIFDLGKAVAEKYELPIELVYQQENGGSFVFCLSRTPIDASGWQWPKEWVDKVQKKKKWVFSTLELKKLNGRMREMLYETLTISATIVHEVFTQVVSRISALYKASEAIALLDVLLCFAKRALDGGYVRPEFTGTLAIKSGRHPMLETIQAAGRTVANDVYASDSSRFQIIQGPKYSFYIYSMFLTVLKAIISSMSGKSTYIRQIGLLSVMASCGSFVPAGYASFKLYDALLTRLSNEDDFERSLSTFSHEMVTSSMILGLSTKDSLILVDELGRGTSPAEGVGMAHAIAEELINRKCTVFFTTHFTDLSATLARYPTVVNLHLSVQRTRNNPSMLNLLFDYKICDGAPKETSHYGLELARLADFPAEIIKEATRVSNLLTEREEAKRKASAGSQITIRRKTLLNRSLLIQRSSTDLLSCRLACLPVIKLSTQLAQIHAISTLSDDDLARYLLRLQNDVGAELAMSFATGGQ